MANQSIHMNKPGMLKSKWNGEDEALDCHPKKITTK